MWPLVCLLISTASAAEPAFSFFDFFQGEWTTQRSVAYFKTMDQELEHDKLGHYSIQPVKGSTNLLEGRYYENDTATGETLGQYFIRIELQTPSSGVFRTGASQQDTTPLFKFDFQKQTNGLVMSHGQWAGDTGAFYSFTVAGAKQFSISVYPMEQQTEPKVTVYLATKTSVENASFFERYGTTVLMAAVFIGMQFRKFMAKKNQ